ncbi:glycosyltransferase family 4 protein [Stenotrophomonas maltophilia]|uniref:glycosyltransferase family 4 protein n=1 Tax=Stenotrophomonas maltophilia TaxID=40324 RepID=UPI00050A27BE|nr:glycosyltransferase family 1 protein [Stenotrophomonas maltophilia]KGM25287.1 hypothetical protein LI87_0102460 [Stenotrophomonas maltophilia]
MKVYFPGRILERHVGGNTTYTRKVAEGLTLQGVEVGVLPYSKNPVLTMAKESFAPLMLARAGAVIHYSADTGPLFKVSRIPSVVTVHGVASRWISTARSARQETVWRARVKRAISSTNRVITVSRSSADDVCEVFGIERDRISVIPHGIDVAKFSSPRDLSDSLQAMIPAEFILYVGNIEPRKNLQPLLEAVESAEFKRLGLPLVVAGKPAWNFDALMKQIGAAKNVIHVGFVSEGDKIALMQRAQLFVFPSLYEGFGFPVLEAMASGTAVLTSERGSLKEVGGPSLKLPDDTLGRDCILQGLTEALSNEDQLKQCAKDGVGWASRFSWDTSVAAHMEIYRELIK